MDNNTIIVFVEKHEDGTYWATSQNYQGVVSTFAETFEELQQNFEKAFLDNIELAKELEEPYANDYEDVEFDYKMDLSSFFELVPELKISSIAKKADLNESLLRQYKTGKKVASKDQVNKIQAAVHDLGRELLAIHF
ncbi:MAG: hypothetical protein CSA38_02040 [Flavobacteriales bacterium]|nr:MAG: hypothetical protein CSA38_02040 [Flavobacteriales bacterium]